MPVLATVGQAASFLGPLALVYAVLGVLAYGLAQVGGFAARLGLVAVGAVATFTLPYLVIGIAALSCNPGDYECPV
jgi:hypothetical protein